MNKVERAYIFFAFAVFLAYAVILQFWFIPELNGNPVLVERKWVDLAWYFCLFTAIPAMALLIRDLRYRSIGGKKSWAFFIIVFNYVGMAAYFFLHARKPRPI